MVKNVCVYCSSSSKIAPLYFDIADLLAKLLANNSMNLVYGGGDVGLMGKLARTVKENGGKVIGIIPKIFADKNIVFREADEMIITETMRERKRIMDEKSDAFIALPGGFGTLDELIEILSLKQLHCTSISRKFGKSMPIMNLEIDLSRRQWPPWCKSPM